MPAGAVSAYGVAVSERSERTIGRRRVPRAGHGGDGPFQVFEKVREAGAVTGFCAVAISGGLRAHIGLAHARIGRDRGVVALGQHLAARQHG